MFNAGQAWGHNDISNLNTDPGFDVPRFVKGGFNKENHLLRGDIEGSSLSFDQLADFVRRKTGENLI